jgi:hypothetical protein
MCARELRKVPWKARLAANLKQVANREQSRRIGVPCKTETIAPHILVLFRDIPHILCIIAARRASYNTFRRETRLPQSF